jgi:hypothetical protein
MASINASTSGAGGVITTADNTGNLELQSGGSAIATVSSTGLSLATGKTLSVGGAVGSPFSMKNKIINGDFQIWQRATSATFSADNIYNTADRWQTSMYASGFAPGTRTVSRQEFTTGASPNGSRYFFQMAPNSSADSLYTYMQQPIEDVTQFSNVYVTLSYWASVSSGTISVTSVFRQVFGTGGSPSSAVDTSFPSVTIDTTWKKYSVTALLPSISGKTLGTNNNSNGLLYLLETTNLNGATFRVSQIQLELGSNATQFEWRPYSLELSMCQRYYQQWGKSSNVAYRPYGVGSWVSTTLARIITPTFLPMRTTPSFTYNNPTNASIRLGSTAAAATTITLDIASPEAVMYNVNVASGGTEGRGTMLFQNDTNSTSLELSAEL